MEEMITKVENLEVEGMDDRLVSSGLWWSFYVSLFLSNSVGKNLASLNHDSLNS